MGVVRVQNDELARFDKQGGEVCGRIVEHHVGVFGVRLPDRQVSPLRYVDALSAFQEDLHVDVLPVGFEGKLFRGLGGVGVHRSEHRLAVDGDFALGEVRGNLADELDRFLELIQTSNI